MSTDIDPETGLPRLPENHFFRVTDNPFADFPLIEVMERRSFGPFKWDSKTTGIWSSAKFDSMEEKIFHLCEVLVKRLDGWKQEATDAERFSGDYPPRRLNGNPTDSPR